VTEQLPVESSVHVALLKVPAPLLLHATVPVGVLFVPGESSETVAVHVVEALTGTVVGVQLTLVVVARWVAVTFVDPLEPRWLPSPP
jgi:hypothetical protein